LEVEIHPTALVHPQACLHSGVRVDSYAVVEDGVEIGEGSLVGPHAVIHRGTTLGRKCSVAAHVVLGGDPQHLEYRGAPTFLRIGDRNVLREFVSIHRSFREGEATVVGNDNYIMAYAHIGHDCQIGNEVIITSFAGLSGHGLVEDGAIIGGQVGLHQFVRIGTLAMVGGNSAFNKDVPPYTLAAGRPGRVYGLNVVGLRRREVPSQVRRALAKAFRLLYRSGLPPGQALDRILQEVDPCPEVLHFVEFVRVSQRGICPWSRERRGDGEG
jgi:UDP-N-acetylglucosamine acyltransferase